MPRLFQRTARDPTAPTPGLEQAKLILSFVASLGDGAVALPGLKAVAKMVIQVIEIAQVCLQVFSSRFMFCCVSDWDLNGCTCR